MARFPLALFLLAVQAAASPEEEESLEQLAYRFATDKSHDDHKYVDLYASLFDPIRHSVKNLMEIGISGGQSLRVWENYFSNANIVGLDNNVLPEARERIARDEGARLERSCR